MSHIVSIKTRVTDSAALVAACGRLGLDPPVQGTASLFSAQATGLIVRLAGWRYPVVADTVSGELKFDNYNGDWGAQSELDRLLQAYAVEKTRIEARRELLAIMPAFVIEMLLDAWAAALGHPALVTPTVEGITGEPARTFLEWSQDHASEFQA